MFARIKHLAIVSDHVERLDRFYGELFGMTGSGSGGRMSAATRSDGYLGLNVNPRAPGRQAGLDHFGFEIEDVAVVYDRLREHYPSIEVLKRPGNRPFAGLSTHDPEGNTFDLSQRDMENRKGVYTEGFREHARRVEHVVLRVVDPEKVAEFYVQVFGLMELEKPPSDPSFYLSDGRITFIVSPWKISDYEGGGVERPALEHIGFKVESIGAVEADLDALLEQSPELAPKAWARDPEKEARLELFAHCHSGQYQFCDPDGVLIDLTER